MKLGAVTVKISSTFFVLLLFFGSWGPHWTLSGGAAPTLLGAASIWDVIPAVERLSKQDIARLRKMGKKQ